MYLSFSSLFYLIIPSYISYMYISSSSLFSFLFFNLIIPPYSSYMYLSFSSSLLRCIYIFPLVILHSRIELHPVLSCKVTPRFTSVLGDLGELCKDSSEGIRGIHEAFSRGIRRMKVVGGGGRGGRGRG